MVTTRAGTMMVVKMIMFMVHGYDDDGDGGDDDDDGYCFQK